MATFTGSYYTNDTITPDFVSSGVSVSPFFTYPGAAADIIYGNGGNDTMDGAGGDDSIEGGQGADTLYGSDGSDTLHGGSGADYVSGGNGDDYVRSQFGSVVYVYNYTGGYYTYEYDYDTLVGGSGIDTLDLTSTGAYQYINLQTGYSHYGTVSGFEVLYGGNYNDTYLGSNVSNYIDGGYGDDYITGGSIADQDTLFGGYGNDTLDGVAGTDTVDGGEGNDYIYGGSGAENLNGGGGIDTFNNTRHAGNYSLNLGTGVTNVAGETATGFENAYLAAGSDTVVGTGAANLIDLGAGNDSVFGAAGDDTLYGGLGNDTIDGGSGNDSMAGGAGNDSYFSGAATDIIFEQIGGGTDTLTITYSTSELYVHVDNLILAGTAITGGGNYLTNQITGNASNNTLLGFEGNDTLRGLAGDDRLTGGFDADQLVGGLGRDTFIYRETGHSYAAGQDRISAGNGAVAFEGAGSAVGDRIDLSVIDANAVAANNQAFAFGSTGIGGLSLVASGANTLVRGNIDNDAEFEITILIEDGAVLASAYTAADFIL
ncbi:MAG: calcium-binding protein [Paracoccaceae bacterium]